MPVGSPVFRTGTNLAYDQPSSAVPPRLTSHAATMEQGVYQIAERFYVAVGYGNANMTMVVGDDSVIIIDSLENAEAAREALADLRRFSDKPIKALIYTHSHPDHSSGAHGLLDPAEIAAGSVEIYGHERLQAGMYGNPSLGIIAPARLAYSFGWDLDHGEDGLVEVGLGPLLRVGPTGFVPPTTTFSDALDIDVAGVRIHLRAAPSESDDEIVLWFPDDGVLHAADVIQGECLANLYALRGAVRDVWQWIRAIDMLRAFAAQTLIFGHGRPVQGVPDVAELLTAYRDAMQYLHDQTVRLAAHGLTPDELVEAIPSLPPSLRDHPWLGEFYGSTAQIVRQVYVNYFGWFEGDPTFLDPLPRRARSARYLAAMGGRDAVLAQAAAALEDGDERWAAEIVTHLLRVLPDDRGARDLKAKALRRLGLQTPNPIWRNNYLMAAKEVDGTLDRDRLLTTIRSMANPDVAATMPIALLLRAFATRLNPERAEGVSLSIGLQYSDADARYSVMIRSNVADVRRSDSHDADVGIRTTENVLRGLLSARLQWRDVALSDIAEVISGAPADAERFWSLFDAPVGTIPAVALR